MWLRLALLGCLAFSAFAQDLGNASSTQWTKTLDGPWRFHAGDDMRWASPSFDDSGWTELKMPSRLPASLGFYWIRVHVVTGTDSDPGLLLGRIAPIYEAYWDGQRIGQFGRVSPRVKWFLPRWQLFHLPKLTSRQHLIAIRIWNGLTGSASVANVLPTENRVGAFKALNEALKSNVSSYVTPRLLLYLFVVANGLAGLYFLLLPPSIAPGSAFRWFGLLLLSMALFRMTQNYILLGPLNASHLLLERLSVVLQGSHYFIWSGFGYVIFRRRTPIVIRCVQGLILGATLISTMAIASHRVALPTLLALIIPIPGSAQVALAIMEFRKRSPGAGVTVAPFALSTAASFYGLWNFLRNDILGSLVYVGGIQLQMWDIACFLWIPAMALQIHKMNQRFRDEQQRLNGEMQAARRVQEILLPAKKVQVPGFEIDAVYQPANEVGGDFFQLFPAADDSLLVVVGDVSGKGMKAALLVSLIVGALQNRKSDQPASIVSELNSALLGRSEGGFTTCCCALFSPDGTLTLANAGHLAPYRNGKEIETAPGLPLGVIGAASWDETQILLQPGDRIVWMSDGIVEARNGKRDLLGFARAQELADRPVAEIARAAQEFGQEDDITVVSITRQPVPAYVA